MREQRPRQSKGRSQTVSSIRDFKPFTLRFLLMAHLLPLLCVTLLLFFFYVVSSYSHVRKRAQSHIFCNFQEIFCGFSFHIRELTLISLNIGNVNVLHVLEEGLEPGIRFPKHYIVKLLHNNRESEVFRKELT